MSIWHYFNPVRLAFGPGTLREVAGQIGLRRWILVTHPDEAFAAMQEQLINGLHAPLVVVDTIEPNPSLAMLNTICSSLHSISSQVEVIVALGGGSVIDTAKFLAAGHCDYVSVARSLEGQGSLNQPSLPFIAIPTTAGTGSELTKWATIWDPVQGRKLSLTRDDLYAEAAFIDPELTASLPWPLTLASGLDALSHALESIWNKNASPITREFAVSAALDVLAALPRLKTNLQDREARSLLASGAMKAGLAFSNTQTALAHNISYPITLRYGVPHGIACSFTLPEVMATAIGVDAQSDAALFRIFGDLAAAPPLLRNVLTNLGVAGDPAAYGVPDNEWEAIVADAFSGPRGRNFTGLREQFPAQTIA